MTQLANLMGVGFSPLQVQNIQGDLDYNVTATGSSSQANSYAITASNTLVGTTAANTGVRLPASPGIMDFFVVVNNGASTLNVYPPTSGAINAGSANAAVTLATKKMGIFFHTGSGNYSYVVTG